MKTSNLVIFSILFLLLASRKTAAVTGIGAIAKTRFQEPYNSEGKTTFPARDKAGVYVIKENGNIVYVGYSAGNVYRTMYRHFQKWSHPYQDVNTYADRMQRNKYTVRVIYTTANQAPRLEAYLVNKYQPRDNDVKLKKYAEDGTGEKEFKQYQTAEIVEDMPF